MLQSTERASAKLLKLLFLWGSFHDKLSFTKTSQTWAQAQHFVALWETQEDNYIPSSHLVTEIFHLLCLQKMSSPWCWLGCSTFCPARPLLQTTVCPWMLLWGWVQCRADLYWRPPAWDGFSGERCSTESYLCTVKARVKAVRGEKSLHL